MLVKKGLQTGRKRMVMRSHDVGSEEAACIIERQNESLWRFTINNGGAFYSLFVVVGTIIGIVIPLAWPILILFWWRSYRGWQSFREEIEIERSNIRSETSSVSR